MALFEGARPRKNYDGSDFPRSNTKLVVSGGDSPAEAFKVKPELNALFRYPYYGWYGPLQDVVVSKGMAVALTGKMLRDQDTGRLVPEITIADGTNPVIGIAPYNFIKEVPDRLYHNRPSIITREYIELPYFPNPADAAACKWGLVHGQTGAGIVNGGLKAGDILKVSADPTNKGKLTKWVEGTDAFSQMVGQVLGAETYGSPASWLEWAMWDEAAKREDDAYINKSGSSNNPTDAGYPFDPEYKNGTIDLPGYWDTYTTTPTGVLGINDGAKMAGTLFEDVDVATIPGGATAGQTFVFTAPQKYLTEGTVVVKVGGVAVDLAAQNPVARVDYTQGYLYYTVQAGDAGKAVTMTYKAKQAGTPAYWDFSGSQGAVRVLLKF